VNLDIFTAKYNCGFQEGRDSKREQKCWECCKYTISLFVWLL